MKIRFSALLFSAFTLLFMACNSDDGENIEIIDTAYLMQVETQSPDGDRLVYMVVLPSLDSAINLNEAVEFNGATRVRTFDEKVYVYLAETMEVLKYEFNESNELIETDKLSMAGTGETIFNGTDAIVSNTAAVVAFSSGQLVFWNPQTMEITGTMSVVDDLGAPDAGFGFDFGRVGSNEEVYFAMGGLDFNNFVNNPGARVVVAYPGTQSAILIEDLNLSQGTSGDVDDSGNYYFVGDGAFTLGRYAIPPFDPSFSIQRINAGSTSFDPNFQLVGSDINSNGYEEVLHISVSGDRFVAGVIEAPVDSIASWGFGVFAEAPVQLYTGSTSDWRGTKLSGQGDFQFLFNSIEVDGEFYYSTTDADARDVDDFAGLYKVEGTSLVKVNETVGFIRQVYRIR
ncbi:MAG: hypothetical protein AAGA85_21675 [Bacteroidota bacterium]